MHFFIVKIIPETTSGGRALKFYASVRLNIRRIETIKQDEESVGNHIPKHFDILDIKNKN